MLPDQYGLHQTHMHNADVRRDYQYANGVAQLRPAWGPAHHRLGHIANRLRGSIGLMVVATSRVVRHAPDIALNSGSSSDSVMTSADRVTTS
jgi:hypothetical protein